MAAGEACSVEKTTGKSMNDENGIPIVVGRENKFRDPTVQAQISLGRRSLILVVARKDS